MHHQHHHHHHHHGSMSAKELKKILPPAPIWWSNTIFFIGFHLFAIYGVFFLSTPGSLSWKTIGLCLTSWQLATFGVTIGYHRLWSHRAFTATTPLRIALAWMASLGFQGSAKWWVMRHRLHHRFTDDPVHDPYPATRGLWYAHCGWIFRKPTYSRMKLIEKDDLEADPIVRFQHKYFIYIALFSGLVLPTLVAACWGDAVGGYVWGGLVARLLIWHTTFCINSLAHWTGLQPYTEEVTARGNYLLAILTGGEGNHNYHHLFPQDFRNGPHPQDWDPTKWIIWLLHKYTSLVPTIKRTSDHDILKAKAHVHQLQADRLLARVPTQEQPKPENEIPTWTSSQAERMVDAGKTLLLIDGYFVDASDYLQDHPGGPSLLSNWSIRAKRPSPLAKHDPPPHLSDSTRSMTSTMMASDSDSGYESLPPSTLTSPKSNHVHLGNTVVESKDVAVKPFKDATRAFSGLINNHSQAAKEKMRCLRVAKLVVEDASTTKGV